MKKSTIWFLVIGGVLLFVGFWMMLFFYLVLSDRGTHTTEVISNGGDKIAEVDLYGTILSSDDVVRQFKNYREDRSIRGIIFRVESPGGGVVASQEIYEEVKKTREAGKPVVVSMGALAASGGYYVSCGANRIVANRGTLTGSIGVISQFFMVDPLLSKIGIESNTIKSGKLKDAGNPFRKMTDTDKAYFQDLMDQVHRQFMVVVETERKLDHDSLVEMADGRVFTGEEAVGRGLVDTIGTFEDAVGVAAELAGIKGDPTIVKERKRGPSLFERLFGETKFSELFGLKDEILNQPILQYKMPQGW